MLPRRDFAVCLQSLNNVIGNVVRSFRNLGKAGGEFPLSFIADLWQVTQEHSS